MRLWKLWYIFQHYLEHKEQNYLKLEIFCDIVNVFIVSLNKSIYFD